MLASSSSGNCSVVQAGSTTVLVDAGISARRTGHGLRDLGLGDTVDAVLVSHEHSDHCRQLGMLAKRFGCPIYGTEGTLNEITRFLRGGERLEPIRKGKPFALGDLEVTPFHVSHDAVDPCGYALDDGRARVGVATDLGTLNDEARAQLGRCRALALEANHDVEMLMTGHYPPYLKERIRSPLGHLSNDEAGQALAMFAMAETVQTVILAHLSDHNNRPDLALATVTKCLEAYRAPVEVLLSHKSKPSRLVTLD